MAHALCCRHPVRSLSESRSIESVESEIVVNFSENDALQYVEMCGHMNVTEFPPATDDVPIVSDIPVLVLNGGLDPVTPQVYALPILDTLTTAYAFTMPYGAHVQLLASEACAGEIASQFIADPNTEPDASCIADAEPLEFLLPGD